MTTTADIPERPSRETTISEGIVLDARSVREEILESPLSAHDITLGTVERILALPDSRINMVVHESADDAFWKHYDRVHSEAIDRLIDEVEDDDHTASLIDPPDLVCIVALQGDDADLALERAHEQMRQITDQQGIHPSQLDMSLTDALAEDLATWDMGAETDGAGESLGLISLRDLVRGAHDLTEIELHGTTHWLVTDYPLSFLALYRRITPEI